MAYLFEYHARLNRPNEIALPSVANGWTLSFESTVRDGDFNKRHIHPESLQPVEHVCRPNLIRAPKAQAHGACFEISEQALRQMDLRHSGMTRVELTDVRGFRGWDLDPTTPCFTYIDVHTHKVDPHAVLPAGSLNQLLNGMRTLDRKAEGILKEWQKHTHLPATPVHDLYTVHVSDEGRHLWLSQADKQFSVLLIEFMQEQFVPKTNRTPFEFNKHPDKRHTHIDFRHSYTENHFERRALWGKFLTARDSLLDPETLQLLLHDPCWLVRLALVNNLALPDGALKSLKTDPDPWVARAVRVRLNEPLPVIHEALAEIDY